jgi:uncharacterized protein with LGFP repeats
MSRQRTRLNAACGRIAAVLLIGAVAVLLAPIAAATPESDASDAINAAWNASGGDTGPLGPRDGDVYPAADGFGQNFAGGKIFFSPATGAHMMQGAILDKYMSLGGPTDGDLGFPTIDEGAGKAPDSRNTTFSAADRPVIFWTPTTGARVVRGPINAAWDKLGGSAGQLGVPVDDETYQGDVVSQKFSGGEVSWNRQTRAFTTVPPELADQLGGLVIPEDATSAINAARRAAGGPLGPLGAKDGGQYQIGADGVGQNFAGGKIFYSPGTGASVLTGQVLQKYESVGGPQGDLGMPTSSEVDGGLGSDSRVASFAAPDKPVIFWTPDYGAVIVRGAMNAAWTKLDGAKGQLGAPMADATEKDGVITQKFSGGAISWNRSDNTFTTEPSNLASSLAGLAIPAPQDTPHGPPPPPANSGSKWFNFHWTWWWLLALVPVALLAALVLVAVLRNRRGGDELGEYDDAEHGEHDWDHPYPVAAGQRNSALEDGEQAEPFGSRSATGAPEQPASLWAGGTDRRFGGFSFGDHDDEHDHDHDDHDREHDEDDDHGGVPLFGGRQPEPDDSDTTPNRVEVDQTDTETPSGRHAAIVLDEPMPAATSIHLPLADPNEAPDGYPIKADTTLGQYWPPDSRHYDDVTAEIWFSSEEFARTNGFVRAD